MEEQKARRDTFHRIMAGKRAALFDFDGVIADSEYFHFASYNKVFQSRLGHSINPEEYWIHWTSRGEGIDGEVRRHNIEGADKKALRDEKDLIYYEYCCSGRIRFFPCALDVMTASEERNLKTAIASNSHREWIEAIFQSNRVTYRPPYLVGKTPEMRPKPAPDIFLAAANEVGEPPEACVVFEDAEKGLDAARSAGMACIIIKNPLNQGIEFREADLIVQSHQELLSLFLSRRGGNRE